MGVGPLRRVLTGTTARRAVRPPVFSRAGAALAVLVVVAGAASAAGPAASRHGARVPSSAECRRLLGRSPAPRAGALRPRATPRRGRRLRRGGADGQRYVFPTGRARAVPVWFPVRRARQLDNAARLLQPLPYDVKQLGDAGTPAEKRFVLLEERKSKGRDGVERYRRAWGLFVIATTTRVPVLAVEVPHPCRSTARCNAVGGDRRTHTMAVTTFERAGAKYLFVAGTDRGATAVGCPEPPCSADAAHEPAGMFEAVHEAALAPRLSVPAATRVYQPHGFATTNHPPSCRQVVVSAGLEQDPIAGDRDDASGSTDRGRAERRGERRVRRKGAALRPGHRPAPAARRPRRLLASGRPGRWPRSDHERPGPVRSAAHPGS